MTAPLRSGTAMTALPSFDRSAIEAHVSLLHDLAAGLDGILILAAFEENGKASVLRFKIGDVDGMVNAIMGFDDHPCANLYAPWAVMRRDLEPGKKGAEADVVAVLAAVGDNDGDKGIQLELPIEAPYIVESSPGNFHPTYVFDRPLARADAKPVLTALSNFIGGDSATKDCSHVWRIPGTLNIPIKSKLARGRSPIPAVVTIKKYYDGRLVDPGSLLALAPPTRPRQPNGHDAGAGSSLSGAEEARLRGALKVISADDRDIWLKAGAALHLVGARAVCVDWSKTSGKFDAADQDGVWASFHGERKEGVVTIATIYAWAKERGWVPSVIGGIAPEFSEDQLALDFAALHSDKLRYVAAWGKWLIWTGSNWQLEDTLRAWDLARRICRDAASQCKQTEAKGLSKAKTVAAVEMLARSDRRIAATIGQWDAEPSNFNTKE